MNIVLLDILGQIDPLATRTACIRVFEQRGEHLWPPTIVIPQTWKTELESLAAEHRFPLTTGEAIISAFAAVFAKLSAHENDGP